MEKIISCGKKGNSLNYHTGKKYRCGELMVSGKRHLCPVCKIKNQTEKKIKEFNEENYGHLKDSCESQEYDAINNLIEELNKLRPKTK